MSGYEYLAQYYDRFTQDVDYSSFARFYEELFKEKGVKVESIVDLACGTGTVTDILTGRGYDMTGVDASPEMLMQASAKNGSVLYLNQPLNELDLYGTYDAAICCLDGINYCTPESIGEIFRRVNLFVRPGGLFIFDIRPPEYFRQLDGQAFIDEDEDVCCMWRAEFNDEENACHYGFDIFVRTQEGLYERLTEEHTEYAHRASFLESELSRAGFSNICEYSDRKLTPPIKGEERIFFCAASAL